MSTQNDEAEVTDLAVKTLMMLAVDGVEKAASGHPGTPMALASITTEIFLRELRYDPSAPSWPGRDRFVLSCGHASMLLYGALHLAGYELSLDDLKAFRQWGSKTPGHPEAGLTPGVETTTGPLGQGISNAVGMATALKMLDARFPGEGLFGGRVIGICSDGDLMEGVSAEASSLAGHLGLDNLVFFYDDNKITIDGDTSLAFSEDVGARYRSYGWHVTEIDGHDHAQIRASLRAALAPREGAPKPTLIVARTIIGKGSPNKAGSHKVHGEPLGASEVAATKKALGWPLEPTFHVPPEVYALYRARAEVGRAERLAWEKKRDAFLAKGGEQAELYRKLIDKVVPDTLLAELVAAAPKADAATRVQSGLIEQRAAALVPSLVGGSADLNPSTKTYIEGAKALARGSFEGRNVHFGIREHAMGSFVNGMALTEGFIPFGSTFLVFSDYMRPALRIAALSHLQSLFVFTHDSVYLGEDGPTHQPVEHFWALRLIPNLDLVRPCDALECAAAWTHALTRRHGPTAFALTRQKLPNIPRAEGFDPAVMLRGAYAISDASDPTHVLVASGSEVSVALGAKALLEQKGHRVRVVSALCWDAFLRQPDDYRAALLPAGAKKVAIEVGVTAPWLGACDLAVGRDEFGASAPDKVLQRELGMTPEAVAARIEAA